MKAPADWERPCTQCGRRPPEAKFSTVVNRAGKRYRRSWCSDCSVRHRRAWGAKNSEYLAQKNLEHRLRREYGLSPDAYAEMVAACESCCQICGQAVTGKALHVDHDHTTGQVRGLLCQNCNRGLGMFQDNPQHLAKAIAYLLEAKTNLAEDNTDLSIPKG